MVAGGGSALAQIGPALDELLVSTSGDVAEGVRLVRSILTRPLWRIATNAGADAGEIVTKSRASIAATAIMPRLAPTRT